MSIEHFTAALVRIAKAEVGVRESGNNAGTRIREYQSRTWLAPGSWAWCAAFVCWCIGEAVKAARFAVPIPNTPRAREFEDFGRKHFDLIRKPRTVIPGDLVIYCFPSGWHIGIAIGHSDGTTVDVVEGNTDATGGREGDGVHIRNRSLSSIHSIVSWNRANPVPK